MKLWVVGSVDDAQPVWEENEPKKSELSKLFIGTAANESTKWMSKRSGWDEVELERIKRMRLKENQSWRNLGMEEEQNLKSILYCCALSVPWDLKNDQEWPKE
ncbi:hypothetical protein Tco_0281278 [Tanacetum coccineum]